MNITTDHLLECLQGYAKANMEKDLQIVALKRRVAELERFQEEVGILRSIIDNNEDITPLDRITKAQLQEPEQHQ